MTENSKTALAVNEIIDDARQRVESLELSRDEKTKAVATISMAFEPAKVTDLVMNRIGEMLSSGKLVLPPNYNYVNALQAAYLKLLETKTGGTNKRPVLEACSKTSIADALLKMVVSGWNVQKQQCAFIAYGESLSCQPEYFGRILDAKRFVGIQDVRARAVYEGEAFEFGYDELGRFRIHRHTQTLESKVNGKVVGAYCLYQDKQGEWDGQVMTIAEIKAAWAQRRGSDETDTHRNFQESMALKTVINRTLKIPVNSSDDSASWLDFEPEPDLSEFYSQKAIAENANQGKPISIEMEEPPTALLEEVAPEEPEGMKEQSKLFE